jgi:hypothetical protein
MFKNLFDNLKPAIFKYNDKLDITKDNKYQIGVMAQDIREGLEKSGKNPDDFSIVKKEDNGYYSVDYIQLIPILISEIQKLEKRVKELENMEYNKAMEALYS